MTGWSWCIVGLVLLGAEIVVPSGFYLFLLGVAALGVAFVTGVGLMPEAIWPLWTWQALAFSIFSIALLVTVSGRLRKLLVRSTSGGGSGDTIGRVVKLTGAVMPGEFGTVEMWGVNWRIKNVDTRTLEVGTEATVVGSEGVTLHVKGNS